MRATITPDGDLIVSPGNDTESFALRMWSELHAQGRASVIVQHRQPEVGAAMEFLLSADGNLTAGELRQQVRERFGPDVDAELARRFGKHT